MGFSQEQKNLKFPLVRPFVQQQEHKEALKVVHREQSTKENSTRRVKLA